MGLLDNIFTRTNRSSLSVLPSGSFTVDREGRVLTSTLTQTFPADTLEEIGRLVLETFRAAHQAQLSLTEISVNFSALKVLARELRGGALVFLSPQCHSLSPKKP